MLLFSDKKNTKKLTSEILSKKLVKASDIVQVRIQTGFQCFTKNGQTFYHKIILIDSFRIKENFQVEEWKILV